MSAPSLAAFLRAYGYVATLRSRRQAPETAVEALVVRHVSGGGAEWDGDVLTVRDDGERLDARLVEAGARRRGLRAPRKARFADLEVAFGPALRGHRPVRIVGFAGEAGQALAYPEGLPAFGPSEAADGMPRDVRVRDGREGMARLQSIFADLATLAQGRVRNTLTSDAPFHVYAVAEAYGIPSHACISAYDPHSQIDFDFAGMAEIGEAAAHALAHFRPHAPDGGDLDRRIAVAAKLPEAVDSAVLRAARTMAKAAAGRRLAAFLEASGGPHGLAERLAAIP